MLTLLKSSFYVLLLEAGRGVTSIHTPQTVPSSLEFIPDAAYNASISSRYHGSGSICSIQYPYCALRNSSHALDGLEDVCVLWDKSCSSSKALAAQKLMPEYNKKLLKNFCFFNPSPDCTARNPPGRMSALAAVRDWMRSPQCSADKEAAWPKTPGWNGSDVDAHITFSNWTCCGPCMSGSDIHVEIYYWQGPNADTSCQSIIGNNDSLATEGGVRGFGGHIYFRCTSFGPHTSTIITTATLLLEQENFIRVNYYNPWDPSPCGNASFSIGSDTSSTTLPLSGVIVSTHSQAHPLIITDRKASTLVSGRFTFTSPSIYANFHPLGADDNCGALSFPSRILAFSPGELSTFVGLLQDPSRSSAPFNPADLPCPPRSIMSEQWYTPLPGISFFPNFILLDRVSRSVPEFQSCVGSSDGDLTYAFDPPKALRPAAALDGPITPNAPIPASTIMPAPNAIPTLGDPEQTGPSWGLAPSPFANIVQAPPDPPQTNGNLKTDLLSDPASSQASVAPGQNDQQQQQTVDPSDPSQDPNIQPQITRPGNTVNTALPNDPNIGQAPPDESQQGQNQQRPADPSDPPQDLHSSQAPFPHIPPFAPFPSGAGKNPFPAQTQTSQQPQSPALPSVFTLGSTTFTANPTAFAVAPGSTLSAGGSGAIVAGTSLTLDPSGILIIGGTQTVSLVPSQDPPSTTNLPMPLTLVATADDGEAVTLSPVSGGSWGSVVVADGKTLSTGGAGVSVDAAGARSSGNGGDGIGGGGDGWRTGVFVSMDLGGIIEVGTKSVALPTMTTDTGENWNLSASSASSGVVISTGEGTSTGRGVAGLLWWFGGVLVFGGWGVG